MPPPRRVPPSGVADVLLRAPAPRPVRLHWPATGPTRPGLVVLFAGGPADALADRAGAVVLAAPEAHLGSAHAALAWAADHAAELGADPARIAVVGPAELVGSVARRVQDEGWPPLRAVVAVEPGDDPADALLTAGWAR